MIFVVNDVIELFIMHKHLKIIYAVLAVFIFGSADIYWTIQIDPNSGHILLIKPLQMGVGGFIYYLLAAIILAMAISVYIFKWHLDLVLAILSLLEFCTAWWLFFTYPDFQPGLGFYLGIISSVILPPVVYVVFCKEKKLEQIFSDDQDKLDN